MAAILAKKLGMTQRFGEGGRVERVTVLEAGPCPVTAIRSQESDGYEAVQLAFGRCREKALAKPELGHLRKANASPHRHLAEFRDEAAKRFFVAYFKQIATLQEVDVELPPDSPTDYAGAAAAARERGMERLAKRLETLA